YLPHLDYDAQRFGPHAPETARAVREVDALCGELIADARTLGYRVVVLSEYGLTPVTGDIPINRVLRRAGLLRVRQELGRELLDAGASEAFAVADHQVAHVYVRRPERVAEVHALVREVDGVESVFRRGDLDHPAAHARAGELFLISRADRWFSYYYWLHDDVAPDFARCVDIHRKPGYDPVELFVDPDLRWPKFAIGRKLAAKKLGFRQLMDVIPLRPELVRGSHGRVTDEPDDGPVLISSETELVSDPTLDASEVKALLLRHVFNGVDEPLR
ncbi:MAG: alkaline phosphatase family protein, partial [Myxococcales bacterium FL481]